MTRYFGYMYNVYGRFITRNKKRRTDINKLPTENKPYERKCTKTQSYFMWQNFQRIDLRFNGDNWPFVLYLNLWLWHWTLWHAICMFTFASFHEIISSLFSHTRRHTPWKLIIMALKPCFFLVYFSRIPFALTVFSILILLLIIIIVMHIFLTITIDIAQSEIG